MRIISLPALLLLAVTCSVSPAQALLTFGGPAPLASNAADDDEGSSGYDSQSTVGSDGNGTWLAAWRSPSGILLSRSTDDGRSWAAVFDLGPGSIPALAYRNGTWLASTGVLHRSTDGGTTWTTVDSPAIGVTGIAADSGGNWIIVGTTYGPGGTYFLARSVSTDDGLTWSPIAQFDNGRTSYGGSVVFCDDAGTCVAAWSYAGIVTSSSTDGGQSWSPPQVLLGGGGGDLELAGDGQGTWMLTCIRSVDGDRQVHFLLSVDDGATWSLPAPVGGAAVSFPDTYAFRSRVDVRDGIWNVSWSQYAESLGGTIGKEGDIVASRSIDNGATWSDPSALNVNAGADLAFRDWRQDVSYAPNGTAIMVWSSTNWWFDTIGTDEDIYFARSEDNCPPSPLAGCSVPTRPEASKLKIRNRIGGADKLDWTWKHGSVIAPGDLGDPTTSTSYALCMYSGVNGSERIALEADAPAAADCGLQSCWSTRGDGFRYGGTASRHGSLNALSLAPGAEGRSSIRVRAAGPSLSPPAMPLATAPAVRVQLVNLETNRCWEAMFSNPSKNDGQNFKASSD